MLVKIFGSAVFGVEATTIIVEVNIDGGIGYHCMSSNKSELLGSKFKRVLSQI